MDNAEITYFDFEGFVGHVAGAAPEPGSFLLFSGTLARLIRPNGMPGLASYAVVPSEGALDWLSGRAFAGMAAQPARIAEEIGVRVMDVLPPPDGDNARAFEPLMAAHRCPVVGGVDLIAAAALGRSALFSISVPPFLNGVAYTVPMLLSPSSPMPVQPIHIDRILTQARDGLAVALTEKTKLPVRFGALKE